MSENVTLQRCKDCGSLAVECEAGMWIVSDMEGIDEAHDCEFEPVLYAPVNEEREAEFERMKKELEHRRSVMSRFPFCPDHRDKVAGLECRECEIERLRKIENPEREAAVREMREALVNLFALVNGECPSLLDGDHHYDMCENAIDRFDRAEGRVG